MQVGVIPVDGPREVSVAIVQVGARIQPLMVVGHPKKYGAVEGAPVHLSGLPVHGVPETGGPAEHGVAEIHIPVVDGAAEICGGVVGAPAQRQRPPPAGAGERDRVEKYAARKVELEPGPGAGLAVHHNRAGMDGLNNTRPHLRLRLKQRFINREKLFLLFVNERGRF